MRWSHVSKIEPTESSRRCPCVPTPGASTYSYRVNDVTQESLQLCKIALSWQDRVKTQHVGTSAVDSCISWDGQDMIRSVSQACVTNLMTWRVPTDRP